MSAAREPSGWLWFGIGVLALALAATCAQPVEPDQMDLDARKLPNPVVTPDVPTSTVWPEQRR